MVSFGNASGPVDPFPTATARAEGFALPHPPDLYHYMATREELERAAAELFEIVASGKVKIEIGQRFALKDAAEAHRAAGGAQDHRLDRPHGLKRPPSNFAAALVRLRDF